MHDLQMLNVPIILKLFFFLLLQRAKIQKMKATFELQQKNDRGNSHKHHINVEVKLCELFCCTLLVQMRSHLMMAAEIFLSGHMICTYLSTQQRHQSTETAEIYQESEKS